MEGEAPEVEGEAPGLEGEVPAEPFKIVSWEPLPLHNNEILAMTIFYFPSTKQLMVYR